MLRFAAPLLAVSLGIGCTTRSSAVWVEAGSSRENLHFSIGEARGSRAPINNLQFVRVSACGVAKDERTVGEQVMWLASGSATPEALSGTFKYGQPPTGLVTRQGPEALSPGCYVIDISGAGVSAGDCFELDSSGAVRAPQASVIKCQVRDRAS